MIHLYFIHKPKAAFESPTTNTVLKNQSILFLLHFIDGRKSIGAFHSGHDTHFFLLHKNSNVRPILPNYRMRLMHYNQGETIVADFPRTLNE